MLWTPTGPTVAAGTEPTAARFVPLTSGNLGGVVRVWATAGGTFSLGSGPGVTLASQAIPLAAGQDIIVAYGPDVTHIVADVATVFATPGIGRM